MADQAQRGVPALTYEPMVPFAPGESKLEPACAVTGG
jgi:hypothetical protein